MILRQDDKEDFVRVVNYVYNLTAEEKNAIIEKNHQKALRDYSAEAFVKTIIASLRKDFL